MRTFFESIEGKMRNELASAIDYRMLSVCFIHFFRNRKIVHKENLIGNLSLPVSLILFDVEKSRPTSFLAGRGDPLRVLRNTESSLRSRVHYFSLRKHLFGKYLLLSRSPSCAGLVFKKMESLFCPDDPDFYSSFPTFKGFRLRIKSVLLRLISFVSHFSYDKGRKQSTQSRHCSTEKIYHLMGAGFSSFFLLLVVINSVNSSDSFLDNFVITCKFFFSISFVTGLICTFYFCVRGFLTAIGIGG